jgi:hypothetical protein
MSLQQIIGPVTSHACAWPAPDPLTAEANVRLTGGLSLRIKAALYAPLPHWPIFVGCGVGPTILVAAVSRELMAPAAMLAFLLQVVVCGRILSQVLPERASGIWAILREHGPRFLFTGFLVAVVGLALFLVISRFIALQRPNVLVNGIIKCALSILTIYVWPLVFIQRSSVASILAGVGYLWHNIALSMWIIGIVVIGQVVLVGGELLYLEYSAGWSIGLMLLATVAYLYLAAVSFAAALHTLLGVRAVEASNVA